MPEHDLLMQLNSDIKVICATVGRLEEKVDHAIQNNIERCEEYECLDMRVTALERHRWYQAGFAGGLALVVSWLWSVFR